MNAGYASVSRKDQRLERRGTGREPGYRPRGSDGGLLLLVWLVGLYALAVGVALIVLALRMRRLRRGRGLQSDPNPSGGNDHARRRHKRARGRRATHHEPV